VLYLWLEGTQRATQLLGSSVTDDLTDRGAFRTSWLYARVRVRPSASQTVAVQGKKEDL
jgi:hypothetical protein